MNVSRADAHESLERADQIAARVRRKGRSYGYLMMVYGLVSVVVTTGVGLTSLLLLFTVFMPLWGALMVAFIVFVIRQPVFPRNHARLHMIAMLGWGTAYMTALMVGTHMFPGAWQWWAPMGLLTAVAPITVGLIVLRGSREGR